MSDGCQLQVVCAGRADYQRPMLKQATWLANFDLSGMELHCRSPNALAGASHEHKQIRGSMYVEGEGSCSVAQASGRYSPVQSTVYAKSCKAFISRAVRPLDRPDAPLRRLAQQSVVARQGSEQGVD